MYRRIIRPSSIQSQMVSLPHHQLHLVDGFNEEGHWEDEAENEARKDVYKRTKAVASNPIFI